MKSYFAYIRVSTTRQGEEGVSLQEQRAAIYEYATKRGMTVTDWFEEQVSAAKRGRPVFNKIVGLLKYRKASGIIIHKIDRGARNLRDWADMADLMDRGIEVHFAHESIDLHTRSGRLSADILAVVAADYIRNLREETIKGINGRFCSSARGRRICAKSGGLLTCCSSCGSDSRRNAWSKSILQKRD